MKEEDLIALIDDVLKDDDKNNDGFIDYAEFAKSLEWRVLMFHHAHDDCTDQQEEPLVEDQHTEEQLSDSQVISQSGTQSEIKATFFLSKLQK